MKPSETSAAVGYNQYHGIDDLPFGHLEKCAVLEYLARRLWVILEESRPDGPDYHHKCYDPLVIEGNTAHSYVFGLGDGGRHHTFDDLQDLEKRLVQEVIENLTVQRRSARCG